MDASNYPQTGSQPITTDDIPWILSLANERYRRFDPGGALVFLIQALSSKTTLALKAHDKTAFLIASIVAPPWYPKEFDCHVMGLCARPGSHWQAIRLLRESVSWARLRGCMRWRFHSETEHDVGVLCRYVGARQDSPRYVIEL